MKEKICDSCSTQKFERWKGSSGLEGTCCINRCWSSYKINQEGPGIKIPRVKKWKERKKR